jgi:hypothetical protein
VYVELPPAELLQTQLCRDHRDCEPTEAAE